MTTLPAPTTAVVDTERESKRIDAEIQAVVDVALIQQHLITMDRKLDTIQEQTIKTNGRVNGLESWKDKITGAWVVVSLAGPMITGLIVGLVLKLS